MAKYSFPRQQVKASRVIEVDEAGDEMLKLYPHLISHFHTFHFQQAAKLSKMSVRRDEISSMKRKNTINGQRVGCFGVDKPLVCLYLHLYLQLQFHIPLSFCHCI